MTITVLLVDDHAVFAETLAASLGTNADLRVAGIATVAAEGKRMAEELRPDVALVDVTLPDYDGIELSKQLRASAPETKIVVLTGNTEPSLLPRALSAGASGFLLKDASLADVTDAIRRAHAGEVVVPHGVVSRLTAARPAADAAGTNLTDRELQVLTLLADGTDPRGIAKALGITWQTARSYVKNVLLKLDAHSQLEAVAKAVRLGIVRAGDAGPHTDASR